MSEILSRFAFGELLGFLSVGGGLLIGLVAVAGSMWLEVRKTETAASLKQDMLNRGMSAEEIQTVLDAGTTHSGRIADKSLACCT